MNDTSSDPLEEVSGMGPQVSSKASPERDDSLLSLDNSNSSSEEKYFGVYLPIDLQNTWSHKETLVFTDKSEALKVVRKYKRARFKSFGTEAEAMQFVESGSKFFSKIENTPSFITEKLSPFKAPKPQDLVRFRKTIESGHISAVKQMVDENPRFLVSSGDTPAILQEGSRYNAMHVAAKTGHAAICCYILNTISSPSFIKKLYGDSNDSLNEASERCEVLLDLYLNTPDKALNETPLHFASKMGAVDVVEILVAYGQCDRKRRNKFNNTPLDVICSRASGVNANIKRDIANLLGEQYYVPVLRSEDLSLQAVVGEPFLCYTSPELETGRVESKMEVRAVAGPMAQDAAIAFRKKWKTPPRKESVRRSILARPTLYDPEKGLECIGRELAYEEKINWSEYWSFLDSFTDLKSQDGLRMLEDYLRKRFKEGYPHQFREPEYRTSKLLCVPNSHKKTPVGVGRSKPPSKEASRSPLTPVSELSLEFQKLTLCNGSPLESAHEYSFTAWDRTDEVAQHSNMDKLCQVYARRLADAVLKGSITMIASEINHIQTFLGNCKEDDRFRFIPMNRAHSRIAGMCISRLSTNDHNFALKTLEKILGESTIIGYGIAPSIPFTCILNNFRRFLLNGGQLVVNSTDSNEPIWASETLCNCQFPINRRARRCNLSSGPRRLFTENEINLCENGSDFQPIDFSDHDTSSQEESDTSDSDSDDYYTPPTSPAKAFESSSSEDDEPEMFLTDEGPDVFIIGDNPSKLDAAVLDAISCVHLNPHKYPYICRWKHMCSIVSKKAGKERWPSPSLKELIRRKNRDDALNVTPSWHKSRLFVPNTKYEYQ